MTSLLADDPSVQNEKQLSVFEREQETEHLYRMEWVAEIELVLVLQILTTLTATITQAFGEGESWFLRVFYPTRDDLTKTVEYCENNDVTFEIIRCMRWKATQPDAMD